MDLEWPMCQRSSLVCIVLRRRCMNLEWDGIVDLWANATFAMNQWSKWLQNKAYNLTYCSLEQVYELELKPVFNGERGFCQRIKWMILYGLRARAARYTWWPMGQRIHTAPAQDLRYKIDHWPIGHSKSIQRYLVSFASYFLFVRVGTNKLLRRLAETIVIQSLYTWLNGLFTLLEGPMSQGKMTKIDLNWQQCVTLLNVH